MEIERINENTVKFYVTYMDIEDRGFDREEIWYNRERSEQLFWQMMDEVNDEEGFNLDGPLWIQVQAMDKGLEIVVTKAQISKDGHKLELPTDDGKTIDMPVDEKLESMLDSGEEVNKDQDSESAGENDEKSSNDRLSFVIRFQDFEEVIQLSHYFGKPDGITDKLYHFEDTYFLYVEFTKEEMSDEVQENILSQLLEFGHESQLTVHRLEEYGNTIFDEDALNQISKYFPEM
ncbi:adaptor protein MecA [Pontibacillus yanchengensis]|uniref:Adaptor protein MecA n=2 Tax=Pontibacillus yanchengensis TaxID=462910 RepID=A0ACC7VF38_9BACI|nr:adaptor protein MecA [Pontibacillus yanchengensis]MYL32224.1 adaptor protein MecA [Pontibacillus yanchengensis]MYL52804.1 adaptor protein MecA [Pontibacillus yanchengensis]